MKNMRTMLVVDDDEDTCRYICDTAELCGYQARYVTSAKDIEKEIEKDLPCLIFLDLVMPGKDGIEVLRMLSEKGIDSGIILSSGVDQRVLKSAGLLANELRLSIVGSLSKPFRIDQVITLLDKQKDIAQTYERQSFEVDHKKLEQALSKNQLQVYFQPKVNLSSGRLAGCEALIRWIHPEKGVISPLDFIPFAEKSGQIEDITKVVIDKGLEMLTVLKRKGHHIRLAINVPADLLVDISFTDKLIGNLERENVSPDDIIVEVTESGVMNELSSGLDVVTRLRMKGVHLSIDDFGTGHSSMERLANIPFTELKLDRSFVSEMNDESARTIVINSINLGHDLGMTVIAEGIEDEETYRQLARMGCDEAQGFYIARPMPIEGLVEWVMNYEKGKLSKSA